MPRPLALTKAFRSWNETSDFENKKGVRKNEGTEEGGSKNERVEWKQCPARRKEGRKEGFRTTEIMHVAETTPRRRLAAQNR